MDKKIKHKSQFRTLLALTFKQTYAKIGGFIVLGILMHHDLTFLCLVPITLVEMFILAF
jgi:hypothetical protein